MTPNGPEPVMSLPIAVHVEIVEEKQGVFLIRYDKHDDFCGDMWHQSVEQAKAQAAFEYEIGPGDWHVDTGQQETDATT